MLQHLNGKLIALIELARCIHDQQHNVAALQSLAHLDHHLSSERAVWFVDARCIDQNDLRATLIFAFGNVDDALNPITRGLRLRRNDRKLFAHESIEQRGLACVWTAEDANKTRTEGHKKGF